MRHCHTLISGLLSLDGWYFFSVIHQVIEDLVITYLPSIVYKYEWCSTREIEYPPPLLRLWMRKKSNNRHSLSNIVDGCFKAFEMIALYLCLSCCLLWAMSCFVTALYKLHCVNAIILRGIYFGIYISLFDGQPKLIRVGLRIMKGFLVGNWDTCWY